MNETNNVSKTSGNEYNFGAIEVMERVNWLQPGNYNLSITGAKYMKPEGEKMGGGPKTPFVMVSFQGKAGKVDSNLYVTPKAFVKLKYLYENWFEKTCDKDFSKEKNPIDSIGMFFEKAFSSDTAKKINKNMIIGGRTSTTGKVFAEVPFSNFIVPDGTEFIEGPFEVGSTQYILNVKGAPMTPASNSNSVVLDSDPWNTSKDDLQDDMPF